MVLFCLKLEDEVEKLLGDHIGLVYSDQALKLSRLMVRAETTDQRIMLLKILQVPIIPSVLVIYIGEGKFCIRAKWPIRPELILVSYLMCF